MIFATPSPTPPSVPEPAAFTPETIVILFCVLIIAYSLGLITLHIISAVGRSRRRAAEDRRLKEENDRLNRRA